MDDVLLCEQEAAYEWLRRLVGSEVCIRDSGLRDDDSSRRLCRKLSYETTNRVGKSSRHKVGMMPQSKSA